MSTLSYTDTLYVVDCCTCGVTFGFPTSYEKRRRDDHQWWYCPSGHKQHFSQDNPEEQAKKRAAELERQLASRADDLRVERNRLDNERKSHASTKGQLTRARKRAEKGLCQHCNRHFVNVERHMAGQHAELVQR